uniref:uncharacterized protein LOC113475483 isoform X2 n=1 Tax=Ciona intestinalis TaxID=7719 RepID=UPI000EF4C3BE|nr:uncharacterized protein LOC113475483 isoform X2 [Ciona intestinalis]|eukprot:XP_026695457.1 uncharacterized protein LOC113475483 isoform X2 [Ciona intestinalis]
MLKAQSKELKINPRCTKVQDWFAKNDQEKNIFSLISSSDELEPLDARIYEYDERHRLMKRKRCDDSICRHVKNKNSADTGFAVPYFSGTFPRACVLTSNVAALSITPPSCATFTTYEAFGYKPTIFVRSLS